MRSGVEILSSFFLKLEIPELERDAPLFLESEPS